MWYQCNISLFSAFKMSVTGDIHGLERYKDNAYVLLGAGNRQKLSFCELINAY